MVGAGFFSLRNDGDWVIPVFKSPFTAEHMQSAFRTLYDPDAYLNIPVTHKFRNFAAAPPWVGRDQSIHFTTLDEGRPEYTDFLAWVRDAEVQVLAGVNWANLNKGRTGGVSLNDVVSSVLFPEERLQLWINPQSNPVTDLTKKYGPEASGYTRLPIEVIVGDGLLDRDDLQWSSPSETAYTYFDPDRGVRSNVNPVYNPDVEPVDRSPIQYLDARYPRYTAANPGIFPVNNGALRVTPAKMSPVLQVTEFDPSTWGALPVTSTSRWDSTWKITFPPALPVDYYWAGLRPAPGDNRVSDVAEIKWSGRDPMPDGSPPGNPQAWYNQDTSTLPHYFVESSDGALLKFAIKIYSNATIGWKLAAVSSRIVSRYDGYLGTPNEDCRDRLVVRYNPRAKSSSVGLYVMDFPTDLSLFTNDMYNTDPLEWAQQLFSGSGTDALLGVSWYYGIKTEITRRSGGYHPRLGKTEFDGVTLTAADEEIVEYHMGTIVCPAPFGDHRDFTEVTYKMWIPMVGWIDLNNFDVVGQTLAMIYYINIVDGSAIVQIQNCADCTDGVIFATSLQYGVEIPLRINPQKDAGMVIANTAIKTVSGAIGGASVGGVAGAVAGGLFGAAGGLAEGSNTGITYSVGSLAPNTNMMSDFRPKLVMYAPSDLTGSDYASTVGLPSAETIQVSDASGFLRASEVKNTNALPARHADEIVSALKSGVYLS